MFFSTKIFFPMVPPLDFFQNFKNFPKFLKVMTQCGIFPIFFFFFDGFPKSKYQIWELSAWGASLWCRCGSEPSDLEFLAPAPADLLPCIRLNRGWDGSLDIFGIGVFAHLYLLNDTTSPVPVPGPGCVMFGLDPE